MSSCGCMFKKDPSVYVHAVCQPIPYSLVLLNLLLFFQSPLRFHPVPLDSTRSAHL